jgi:signal transduction histidine kinase
MPAIVFVLGLAAMGLLLWMAQITVRQRQDFALADIINDLQVKAASVHLSVREGESRAGHVSRERVVSDLGEGWQLCDLLLNGGQDHGLFVRHFDAPDLRRQAAEVARLFGEFDAVARDIALGTPAGTDAGDREAEAFSRFSRSSDELERTVEAHHTADHHRWRRLFSWIVIVWSGIVLASTIALVHRDRARRRAEETLRQEQAELEDRVAQRTRQLSVVNAELAVELTERRRTEAALKDSEEQLRHLSAAILTAQETERRRISTDLHDGLGHSLVLLKLRLGMFEKEFASDRPAASSACNALLQTIDETIDDVRRMSRDLRPAVLEDLGLPAAIRWLVEHCPMDESTLVRCHVDEIDGLSQDAELAVYRIVQEALTNAGKHAHARRVSVVAERRGNEARFVVEDDGDGFDATVSFRSATSDRGLGLATMHERARIIRGSLTIRSAARKGTRMTLTVPLKPWRSPS